MQLRTHIRKVSVCVSGPCAWIERNLVIRVGKEVRKKQYCAGIKVQ